MAKGPSKVVLVAALVMGVGAMVMFNSLNQRLAPKVQDDDDHDEQAAATPAPAQAAPAKPARVTAPATGLASLGQDATVGATNPASPEVDVRWSWTPSVQKDPNKVYNTISALKAAVPGARIHVVNTDEDPNTPDGVFVGGKQIAPAAADGSIQVDPNAVKTATGLSSK